MSLVQGTRRRRSLSMQETLDEGDSTGAPTQRQTQRRRTQHASDDEGFGGDEYGGNTQAESVDEMAKKLVRLALACEYQRRPIRRADISEKVLGTNGRQFKQVFNKAQSDLEAVFGMRMAELPAKEKVTLQQRRAAQKSASQAKSSSNSWVVISTLPSELRDPKIISPASAPTSVEESTYTGIYTILVALIALSGDALPDAKMDRYLRKLGLEDNTPIPEYDKTEKLLKRMEKDGYVVKIRESTGTGEDDIYWMVGPRGKVETDNDAIRGLVLTVFGDQPDEEAELELDRKIERSLGAGERVQAQRPEQPTAERPRNKRGPRKGEAEEVDEEDEDDDSEDEDE